MEPLPFLILKICAVRSSQMGKLRPRRQKAETSTQVGGNHVPGMAGKHDGGWANVGADGTPSLGTHLHHKVFTHLQLGG